MQQTARGQVIDDISACMAVAGSGWWEAEDITHAVNLIFAAGAEDLAEDVITVACDIACEGYRAINTHDSEWQERAIDFVQLFSYELRGELHLAFEDR